MSTLQIQPGNSTPPNPPQRPDGNDFYDPGRWESAYREMHDVPALLIQLQDDLSRSRRREAFWISVVFHLLLVIAVVNADKLAKYLPKGVVMVVSPRSLQRQSEPTFLELPPDEQKLTKRPNTNIISDKDRMAMSRHPQLDTKELKKILDSARPGAPGPSGPALNRPPQPAQPPATAMAQSAPEQQAPPPRPAASANQMAKLTMPQNTAPAPKPSFTTPAVSPGRAIEQAARAALANPGGYGGDNGDMGLGAGKSGVRAQGQLDVLSDTKGVDFGPYLNRVLHDVRQNWYNLIPEVARAPLMKKGKVSIEFAIMKDGRIEGLRITSPDGSSGDNALDRAAWGGITASNPFPPLPQEFGGQYLALRFHFYYNPDRNDLE